MSGLWLKDGTHYNITYEGAMQIAEEIKSKGVSFFGGTEVESVLPVKESSIPRILDNSKRLLKPEKTNILNV